MAAISSCARYKPMLYTIFTGGTIGSEKKADGTFSPGEGNGYQLLQMYRKSGGTEEFRSESILGILSENLAAKHIQEMVAAVDSALKNEDCEGVLVMHGTDTMAYTAAFLGYLFSAASVPVFLITSRAPLDDPTANGLANFAAAVQFIREGGKPGVYVSYQNLGEEAVIHYATRLLRHDAADEGVRSVLGGIYPKGADLAEDIFPVLPQQLRLTQDADHLLRIEVYPGMKLPQFTDKTKAVLLEAFHSGTIPASDKMRRFLTEARGRDIPVFLTGIASGARNYETIDFALKEGVIPLYDRAPISQYVKLWLLTDHVTDVADEMKKNHGHETVPYRLLEDHL